MAVSINIAYMYAYEVRVLGTQPNTRLTTDSLYQTEQFQSYTNLQNTITNCNSALQGQLDIIRQGLADLHQYKEELKQKVSVHAVDMHDIAHLARQFNDLTMQTNKWNSKNHSSKVSHYPTG